jgi:hypothetical protein
VLLLELLDAKLVHKMGATARQSGFGHAIDIGNLSHVVFIDVLGAQ